MNGDLAEAQGSRDEGVSCGFQDPVSLVVKV